MLKDLIPAMVAHIKNNQQFIDDNHELLDIYEGNLVKYVDQVLRSSLADNYYKTIKDKIVPINILNRVIDKLAKVYSGDVKRISETDQELVDYYVGSFKMNSKMIKADEYSNLFRGYLLEPYLYEDHLKLRVLPYDRFLPFSHSHIDPTKEDVIIKYVGKKLVESKKSSSYKNVYYAFSSTEFMAFTEDEEIYYPALKDNEGVNPFGVIPFVYANRSDNKLVPTHNYDAKQMAKLIPCILTDMVGCIQYQAFSMIFGIDIDMENVRIGPNAIWSLKSDLASQKAPQLGTIKPDADIAEVVQFVQTVFTLWLESLSIRVNGSLTEKSSNASSGIAKIIDEMDTIDARKKAMEYFIHEEREFWMKLKEIHNFYVSTGQIRAPMFSDSFTIDISFQEPRPFVDKEKVLAEIQTQVSLGLMTRRMALKELYPDYSQEAIETIIQEVEYERKENKSDRDNGDHQAEENKERLL